MEQAKINLANGILEWASKGHDIYSLNKKFPNFSKWLNKEATPTFKQLEKLAKYLDFPFGYFFLSQPLLEISPDNIDFRTIKNAFDNIFLLLKYSTRALQLLSVLERILNKL